MIPSRPLNGSFPFGPSEFESPAVALPTSPAPLTGLFSASDMYPVAVWILIGADDSVEPGCLSENAQIRLIGFAETDAAGKEKTARAAEELAYDWSGRRVAIRVRVSGTVPSAWCSRFLGD